VTEKTILIADDDHELVHALAVRCRRLGLGVLCAHDSFSALSLVRTSRPDVVCLDVDMPAGNGLCVCEMLSADGACRTIPIMILTGRTDPETIMRCHTLCAYYVEKCADVWSRVEPLLKELLSDLDTTCASAPAEHGEPAVHHSLHRG
jgi:DNA-binding response OmpR family regulator